MFQKKRKHKIIMPEDGWDDRAVTFYCEHCGHDVTEKSIYLNMDFLIQQGMTQVEFFKALHDNDEHPEVFDESPPAP